MNTKWQKGATGMVDKLTEMKGQLEALQDAVRLQQADLAEQVFTIVENAKYMDAMHKEDVRKAQEKKKDDG